MATENTSSFTDFKFRDLLSYASPEFLADGKKRYRKVFDASKLSYVYAELSLYNKRFDLEDWELKVIFKCHPLNAEGQHLKELASQEVIVKVSKDQPIIYAHHGWGNANPGAYWTVGTYAWVAWIDDVAVGEQAFGVQSEGTVTHDHNPYFDIVSVKLFEGPSDLPHRLEDRNYTSSFQRDTTRYLWAECMIKNLQRQQEWVCEMSFMFYTSSRELKGRNDQLALLAPSMVTGDICGGWGSSTAGTWYDGEYTLEIVFMEQLIAVLPFEIGTPSRGRRSKPGWLDGLKPKNWLFGKK